MNIDDILSTWEEDCKIDISNNTLYRVSDHNTNKSYMITHPSQVRVLKKGNLDISDTRKESYGDFLMIRFKDFLLEERSDERATKILDKISKGTNKVQFFPYAHLVPDIPKDHEWYYHGTEEVPIKSIKSMQLDGTRVDKLKRYIANPPNAHNLPLVFQHTDGFNYLNDGNNRSTIAKLKKHDTITADVHKIRKINR